VKKNKPSKDAPFTAPVFEAYPALDNAHTDAHGVPVVSDASVAMAKRWIEENEL